MVQTEVYRVWKNIIICYIHESVLPYLIVFPIQSFLAIFIVVEKKIILGRCNITK